MQTYLGKRFLCKGYKNAIAAEEWAVNRYNELTKSTLAYIGQKSCIDQIIFTNDVKNECQKQVKPLVTFSCSSAMVDLRLKAYISS